MSDDIWRRKNDETGGGDEYGTDFGDFGTVQFADDVTNESPLSMTSDSGPLPHWTEPPTGEVPRFVDSTGEAEPDVWTTFQNPTTSTTRGARLTIGSDPTDDRMRRPVPPRDTSYEIPSRGPVDITGGQSRPAPVRRAPTGSRGNSRGSSRDMPTAVTTGLVLVAAFIATIMWRPAAVMLIVVAVVGLAAVEFFQKVTEKGYRPATFAGIIACVSAPLAAYWIGDAALPLVLAFGFLATTIGFLGSGSVQSGPMPNSAITSTAIVWIGLLGSFAALILRYSTLGAAGIPSDAGTDTLFLLVAGVVANDVGALFVGSTAGRTPVREWVSPNKTLEGLIGGAVFTFVVIFLLGSQSDTWNSFGEWFGLALVVAVMAPLGDMIESMFKRNLDVKDFGTLVAGHGGVLDRFDSFLFVLPAVYYLMLVVEPWAK